MMDAAAFARVCSPHAVFINPVAAIWLMKLHCSRPSKPRHDRWCREKLDVGREPDQMPSRTIAEAAECYSHTHTGALPAPPSISNIGRF